MSNILNNTTSLQELLEVLQTKATPSGGTDTSDATATADEIFAGETAYANGSKVTGTFTIDSELTTQNDLISQILALIQTKANYNTLYVRDTEPTDDIGKDGDIYIKIEVTT